MKNWNNLELRYIDDNGKVVSYKDQIVSVNKETGEVVAKTYHFSTYGIFEVASAGTGDKSSMVVSNPNPGSNASTTNVASSTVNSSNVQDTGNTLPKTANNTYNIMLIGGLLVLLGLGTLIVRNRRVQ